MPAGRWLEARPRTGCFYLHLPVPKAETVIAAVMPRVLHTEQIKFYIRRRVYELDLLTSYAAWLQARWITL